MKNHRETNGAQPKTGELLVALKQITTEQLNICLAQQYHADTFHNKHIPIGELIISNGFASRDSVAKAIAKSHGHVELGAGLFNRSIIPSSVCRKMGIKLLGIDKGNLIVSAINALKPKEVSELISVAKTQGVEVNNVLIQPMDRFELMSELRSESMVSREGLSRKLEQLHFESDSGQVIKSIINEIMIDAIQSNASDIHVDKIDDSLSSWISFRIYGDLQYRYLVSTKAMAPLMTRFKAESGMDSSELRRSQDGRFAFSYQGRTIDVRVATQPIDGGETLTMRLLDPESLQSLGELFPRQKLIEKRLRQVSDIEGKTGGFVLVTGPTGSGKTTTLYGMILEMARHRLNIMTVEDPVEYRVPMVRQVQVNNAIDQTFANVLRSQLRHDPDVLIVGELRDEETAEAALRSAESGHMVLSTLHTIDAMQALERIVSLMSDNYRRIGLFILANYLKAVINQRLVKRLCSCAVDASPETIEKYREVIKFCKIEDERVIKQRNTSGCDRCSYTGYIGRVMVPECLFFDHDHELRDGMEEALLGSDRVNVSKVIKLPGVEHITRAESVAELLKDGEISIEAALDVLDMKFSTV